MDNFYFWLPYPFHRRYLFWWFQNGFNHCLIYMWLPNLYVRFLFLFLFVSWTFSISESHRTLKPACSKLTLFFSLTLLQAHVIFYLTGSRPFAAQLPRLNYELSLTLPFISPQNSPIPASSTSFFFTWPPYTLYFYPILVLIISHQATTTASLFISTPLTVFIPPTLLLSKHCTT